MTTSSLLIVDDHPMVIDGYINALSNHDAAIDFTTANSCQKAYLKITERYVSQKAFHAAFLDISLPPYADKQINSGVDLARLIRNHFPLCKIILLTMHSESLIVNNAIQELNPEGFILKNDIDSHSFKEAYRVIMNGETFYSATIQKVRNEFLAEKLDFDAIDYQILALLAQKVKTKDMPIHLNLSLSAIEKRKAHIKYVLLKDVGGSLEIVAAAKRIGLL
ncbi:response regulator [Flavobacterium sp.]|uniref:response regulator n=1 Tax=Flavobacterium sp. TaxID=239 RepID=UPI0022C5DE19|nr:response regulator [Flavobacterium sp.]MCZ8230162.1 response regulator [Flavobacterium sp.]